MSRREPRSQAAAVVLVLLSRYALDRRGVRQKHEHGGGKSPPHRRGAPMDEAAGARVLREYLDRWAAAGIIDADQASRIEAAEQARAQALPRRRLPLVAEGLGYLGAVLAITSVGRTPHPVLQELPPAG